MVAKKRGLGKGLDALLSQHVSDLESLPTDQLSQLPVDLIRRGAYQPRMEINAEALQDLANSIRIQGVVQPILVRRVAASDQYEIIAGERRWRAAQLAGLHEIPALVRDVTDQTAMCMALIENIQREDLNPLEEARALSRLLKEFDMTHDQVAESVGRSRSTVTNILRLLELHQDVQKMLESKTLEMGHARAILSLAVEQQPDVARKVASQGLSVRATERLVRGLQSRRSQTRPVTKQPDPNIRRLENELSEQLGAQVAINHSAGGKGTVQIRYNSLDELEGILGKLK